MSHPFSPAIPGPLPVEAPPPGAAPQPAAERRLRLWPGVVLVALLWAAIKVPGWIAPGTMMQFMAMFMAPMAATVLLMVWWLLASRLRWVDRGLGVLAFVASAGVAYPFYHASFDKFGMIIYGLPLVTTAWILWLLATSFLRWPVRRVGLVVVFLLGWGYFALLRFDGVNGVMEGALPFRWTPTAEEMFLADRDAGKLKGVPASYDLTSQSLVLEPGDWPGFRGPDRDGRRTGVRIATDWEKHPPRLVWRHRVGPGWSSFAVVGTRLYTQEQRGEDEVVVCYDSASGVELWAHRDTARFTEPVAGAGPRATPTFHEGKLYTLGGKGRLNCLDAANGKVLWSRDLVADSGAKVPQWGFAASPLVSQGIVTVFAGGPNGKAVLGYHAASGEPAWSAGEGELSYSSLQPARLGGVEQLLLATDRGVTAFQPSRGEVLWEHPWPVEKLARIAQPAIVGDSDVLVGTGLDNGTRRVHVGRDGDKWTARELWTTRAIKPYFNDLVTHKGHLYGFDGHVFTCVRLEDGKKQWRAQGYGNGQVLLLADQDVLLILSEQGEAALVEARPEGHKELARFEALTGKTWNHPVVAHGKLFVRNGEEAACYELAGEGGK